MTENKKKSGFLTPLVSIALSSLLLVALQLWKTVSYFNELALEREQREYILRTTATLLQELLLTTREHFQIIAERLAIRPVSFSVDECLRAQLPHTALSGVALFTFLDQNSLLISVSLKEMNQGQKKGIPAQEKTKSCCILAATITRVLIQEGENHSYTYEINHHPEKNS